MDYPDFVIKRLEDIAERTGISLDELKKEYETLFKSDFVQDEKQFSNDEDRHQYCKGVFWTRYILRKPVTSFNIIPIGMDSVRRTKSTGMQNTSIFALDENGKLRRISFKGDICREVKNLTLFAMYKDVKLGKFKDSSDLIADDRAVFKNPIQVNMDPRQLVETLGLETITIVEAGNNLSKIDSTGYVDKTDWKVIKAFIQRHNKNPQDSENEWGVYTVVDESVDPEKMEPEVTPSGELLSPGFSIWLSPNLMNYGIESECFFLGTISKAAAVKGNPGNPVGKPEKVSMNCYCVVPLVVRYED